VTLSTDILLFLFTQMETFTVLMFPSLGSLRSLNTWGKCSLNIWWVVRQRYGKLYMVTWFRLEYGLTSLLYRFEVPCVCDLLHAIYHW